jgi:hypothetical protein
MKRAQKGLGQTHQCRQGQEAEAGPTLAKCEKRKSKKRKSGTPLECFWPRVLLATGEPGFCFAPNHRPSGIRPTRSKASAHTVG